MRNRPFSSDITFIVRNANLYDLRRYETLDTFWKDALGLEEQTENTYFYQAYFFCEGEEKCYWENDYDISEDFANRLASQYKELNPSYESFREESSINVDVIVCLINLNVTVQQSIIKKEITSKKNPIKIYG